MSARMRLWLFVADVCDRLRLERTFWWALMRAADCVEYEPFEPVSEEDAPW